MTTQTYENWRLEIDTDQILWLYFDKKNSSVNTLDRNVMLELKSIINSLASESSSIVGVVILSAKKSGFIAGADISVFKKFKDIQEAYDVLVFGQTLLDDLEGLKIPTVALIDGFCLGGGTELSLACRYRIAEESAKTRIGLPEVKLGIHPGWGGSVRMPRLIGALQGLNMILSGHTVSGKAAAKLGIADVAVPKRQLRHAARYYILNKPKPHQPSLMASIGNHKFARQLIAYFLRRKLQQKVNPLHYPAPFHALDNWEHVGVDGKSAFEREAKSCAKLFFSETSQNLVRVFFLQERLKGLAKEVHFNPHHVHVIGAGTMGGDIAAWCALQGFTVTLQDMEPKLIAPALKRAYKLYKEKLKEPYLIQTVMDKLVPDIEGRGISKADIIIEAVVENLEIKQKVFKMIESRAKPQAILATNTSSIPLDEINTVLQLPQRLVGIHYFNPVAKMQLVEIVKGDKTSNDVAEKAMNFAFKLLILPMVLHFQIFPHELVVALEIPHTIHVCLAILHNELDHP